MRRLWRFLKSLGGWACFAMFVLSSLAVYAFLEVSCRELLWGR